MLKLVIQVARTGCNRVNYISVVGTLDAQAARQGLWHLNWFLWQWTLLFKRWLSSYAFLYPHYAQDLSPWALAVWEKRQGLGLWGSRKNSRHFRGCFSASRYLITFLASFHSEFILEVSPIWVTFIWASLAGDWNQPSHPSYQSWPGTSRKAKGNKNKTMFSKHADGPSINCQSLGLLPPEHQCAHLNTTTNSPFQYKRFL